MQWETGQRWVIEEVEVREPGPRDALIEVKASGLCHSDDHNVSGDFPAPAPLVGGHEGAGIVVEVGSEVTRVRPGDHVVLFPTPSCGQCAFCNKGKAFLCDEGAYAMLPTRRDGVFPFRAKGRDISSYCQLGTFSQYLVASEIQMLKIDDDIPFEAACLVGCGVMTGWGGAEKVAQVGVGDTVVVVGVGGVGMASVQCARVAGAANIVAVDPVEFKREQAMRFGATEAVADIDEAMRVVSGLTRNVMADSVILTVGVLTGSLFGEVADLVGKGGTICSTSVARFDDDTIRGLPISAFMLSAKNIAGNVFGRANPLWDMPRMFQLYRRGELMLDEMITQRYSLDDINVGYDDMHAGKNVRGVIVY
jgi:S-(hydroxymethyl)glutathione dehydrogenase/alcohol dehydrogenase